jgi:flagella basal body P-ring formation protein FlgA
MRHHLTGCMRKLLVVVATGLAGTAALAQDAQRTVYVPASVIYPGDVITAEALVAGKIVRPTSSPPLFGENIDDLVGKVARRTLMRGELIPNSAIREQPLVMQGRPYKLTYHSDFVSVVGTGIPMKSATVGEMVSVRNPDTGIIIKARVEPDQTLVVEDQ